MCSKLLQEAREYRLERNMTELQTTKTRPSSTAKTAIGRLFVLELNAGVIHTMNILEIDVGELLSVVVANDKALVQFLDRPGGKRRTFVIADRW